MLTVNELNALVAHHRKQRAWEREMAAFGGYCAAAAVAKWYTDGLPPWQEFYRQPSEQEPEQTSEDYIARYNAWQ
ncbi:hypothetical protein M0R72_11090 [Candidatus Pacearchaeota archaeon]|nr:hypothetical protein [Candidatus Pacearchaeota archaeon]